MTYQEYFGAFQEYLKCISKHLCKCVLFPCFQRHLSDVSNGPVAVPGSSTFRVDSVFVDGVSQSGWGAIEDDFSLILDFFLRS